MNWCSKTIEEKKDSRNKQICGHDFNPSRQIVYYCDEISNTLVQHFIRHFALFNNKIYQVRTRALTRILTIL